jgi:TolA-binding protein
VRVDERLELAEHLAAAHLDRADLGDHRPPGEPPVVSRSTTQKVMSRSGRPSSSKLRCDSHRPDTNGDKVDRAAVAYLLGRPDWASVAASAAQADTRDRRPLEATRQVERLQRQLDTVLEEAKAARRRNRDQVTDLKRQNAELRHKLGETRARVRAAEESATRAEAAVVELNAAAGAAASGHEAELRRLRGRIEELESELATVRRAERSERGSEALRARLLLDTLLDTAQGLRRELALPAVSTTPADEVEAHIAEEGSRTSSGHGSLTSDDPVLLDQLLALPRAHLIVDGYNVTKSAWPDLSLERQRDRLLAGLAPLTARSGAEVTVVFDASAMTNRPWSTGPGGCECSTAPRGHRRRRDPSAGRGGAAGAPGGGRLERPGGGPRRCSGRCSGGRIDGAGTVAHTVSDKGFAK